MRNIRRRLTVRLPTAADSIQHPMACKADVAVTIPVAVARRFSVRIVAVNVWVATLSLVLVAVKEAHI